MFISLREAVGYRSMRFYRRRSGMAWQRQQAAVCAGNAVRRVVCMVRGGASRLHVRTRVGPELPLHQWRKCQQHLSGDQETNRRLQNY